MSHNIMQTSILPSPPHRHHASQVAPTFVPRICARRTDVEAGWGLDLVLDSWTFKVNDVTNQYLSDFHRKAIQVGENGQDQEVFASDV